MLIVERAFHLPSNPDIYISDRLPIDALPKLLNLHLASCGPTNRLLSHVTDVLGMWPSASKNDDFVKDNYYETFISRPYHITFFATFTIIIKSSIGRQLISLQNIGIYRKNRNMTAALADSSTLIHQQIN